MALAAWSSMVGWLGGSQGRAPCWSPGVACSWWRVLDSCGTSQLLRGAWRCATFGTWMVPHHDRCGSTASTYTPAISEAPKKGGRRRHVSSLLEDSFT